MGVTNTQISDTIAIIATIDAVDGATSAVTSDWADTAKYPFVASYITIGAVGGVLNAKMQQATDSSGTAAKDIAGAAITAIGASDDNTQYIINVKTEELDDEGGFQFVACVITPVTGANLISCTILGSMPRYAPVLDHDLSTVAEIIDA